ncbi:MAG: ABC transporter permease subunit [Planctomycetes bacterium]|nr:ABC transporter permease subunit [Planctomycetota bacterium]
MLGPIFNREVLTVPRRPQHYLNRAAYLGVLWVLAVTAWQATVGWSITPTLYETSRFGPLLFRLCAAVQLVLLLFFSALAAAAAVAQEKDRRTFVLLLLTDLADYEIVLGKLLGSLLQIALFLAAVVPLLLLITLLGGVAPYQVGQTLLILASTVLAAGSLGTLVALWRDRTFQALALTVLFLVLYLCLVNGLPLVAARVLDPAALPVVDTYQQWFEPFRALDSVHQPRYPDDPPLAPAYGYAVVMGLFSVLLTGWGMLRLRVWNPSGEPIIQREQVSEESEAAEAALTGVGRGTCESGSGAAEGTTAGKGDRKSIHAAPGAVREVGDNPILWREVFTRAYGRRPLLVKLAYGVVFALVCYYALTLASAPGRTPVYIAAYGLVPAGILSLLLIAAQSATAITSERDTGALDLLLVTDLTPREFIFGKLGGILYNTKEYILPPLILIIVYAGAGRLATPPANYTQMRALVNYEAALCMVGAALVLIAFTVVFGVHVSLRTPNSRLAVLNTLSTVFFLSVGTLVCVYLIIINGRFEYQWTSFLVFTVAGVSGLWWVLNGSRPSAALTLASWFCPFAVLYCVINVLVGKPGTAESSDPLMPFFVIAGAFGFTLFAMLVPLLSEFDIALGRTTGANE